MNLIPLTSKALLSFGLLVMTFYSYSQTNTLPTSGNVGIGELNPDQKLTVRGSARIDSTLMVKDSMIVDRGAHVGGDLTVDGQTILGGGLILKNLLDSTLTTDEVILIDSTGNLKRGGDLKSLVYAEAQSVSLPCATDMNGGYIQTAPFWQATNNPPRMFLINTNCSPDPRLGVGTKPEAKLHVQLIKDSELHPLVIDKRISNNPNVLPQKLMQLDHNGLLYAREIKVNLNNWADYVFDENYPLMPLSELQAFIQTNNHLPHVPSAKEMTENGLNVAESSRMLMEKVEELTLYLLQINEQVKKQDQLLNDQQETIRLQQELILQLQKQVNP